MLKTLRSKNLFERHYNFMDKNLSALVLRDTGMNNNDLLKSKMPKCWTIDVLSIKEDKEDISVALPSYDVIVGGRIGMEFLERETSNYIKFHLQALTG